MKNPNKKELIVLQKQYIQDQIDAFKDRISALSEEAQNDAKSSAGDKHETGLSMMHLEQEKLNLKLSQLLQQQQALQQLPEPQQFDTIQKGHLVLVNDLWLFLSEALPKISVEPHVVFFVSIASPLGKALIGQKIKNEIIVQEKKYTIHSIY